MTLSAHRRSGLAAIALVLLSALLLSLAGRADAATINTCKNKKSGAVRVITGKAKCKKTESKLSWTTAGSAGGKGEKGDKGDKGAAGEKGATGAAGANGANGAPGQPQKAFKFTASQASSPSTELVPLFTSDGITYSFNCGFAFLINVAAIKADGPSGTSYASGTMERPSPTPGRQSSDPWSGNLFATLGGGAKSIAQTTTLSTVSGSIEQLSVWTATVEGPTATTWIHASIDANATCSIRGTAITIPNS
jgi:hypothetical protein